MQKGRKPLVVLVAVLIMALASCASTPVNKTEVVEVTDTTTTTVAPVPGVPGTDGSTTTTTVADTTPPPTGPVVSEIVLRNLFGTANALRNETLSFEIDRVLPDSFTATDAEFQKIKADYDKIMDAVTFNGEEAYSLQAPFEASIARWEALLAEGLPLRTQEESDKANDAKFAAMTAQAADLATSRYEGAMEYLAEADALEESGNYQMAIPAYRQAAAAFDVAVEKSRANSLRDRIAANGYAKYAESNFQMGEQKYAAEEDYWASGSTSDLRAGVAALREANNYYEFVISSGAQYKSFEGKDQALASREKALSVKAERNAAEEFASAEDILNEALANQDKGNYESSYLWFVDASAAFDAAYDLSAALKAENGEAMARAVTATAAARQKSDEAGIAKNVYLDEAEYQLARARIQSDNMVFADSTASANEAVNYASLSNNYVDSELKRVAEEEEKKARIAQEAADVAMADARTRMAWAENNELAKDYPSEAKEAKAAMEGADIAYENGRYAPAKVLAEEVSSILSDSFQEQVLAERRLAQEKRLEAEEAARAKAAAKANAETSIADAERRMAWANENSLKSDFPEEFSQASSAMIAAYVSYGNENYSAASVKAKEVSYLLSDDFQQSVLDARKAAAAKAAAKAAAETAIDDARTRMAWAENNELAKDYPAEAREAKAAMEGADIAYANERYEPSKTLAEEVSSILSDDFQKSVLDARKAAAEKAAAKAAADPAMDDARTRMAWAENNELAKDHPAEAKESKAAMEGAEIAYANERFEPAKTLAEEVSSILSDDFQKSVLEGRAQKEAVAEPTAPAEPVVAEQGPDPAVLAAKAEAESAIADAEKRMAWANESNLKSTHPDEYSKASSSMITAYVSFGNENYPVATDKAKEVSSILSDDFQAKVAAERKAAAEEEARKAAAKAAAETAIDDARTRMAWAENNELAKDYPAEAREAKAAMEGADIAYANERYEPSKTLAEEVSSILSDDFQKSVLDARKAAAEKAAAKAVADPAMDDARTRMKWANENNIKAEYPAEYKDAEAAMIGAEIAYKNERYEPAAELAGEVSSTFSDQFKKNVAADRKAKADYEAYLKVQAEKAAAAEKARQEEVLMKKASADIEKAQSQYDWAVSKNAANNYPELLSRGGAELEAARKALAGKDYNSASVEALRAYSTLSNIQEFAPLPATYVVRLIPERRDCLWRIAEYSFIYNNPLKWPVLYEANKKTFKDPSNPDLIFPNQVLVVPSIAGETRSGVWDPKKTYNPLPNPKAKK
jgi:nucleoid-associated protein YgaU